LRRKLINYLKNLKCREFQKFQKFQKVAIFATDFSPQTLQRNAGADSLILTLNFAGKFIAVYLRNSVFIFLVAARLSVSRAGGFWIRKKSVALYAHEKDYAHPCCYGFDCGVLAAL
jgi:hypothetical protein